jgi:DNA helicase IV
VLDRAARDVLTEHERDLLARKPTARLNEEQWTTADAAVLDEADAILNRTTQQYGHIIVDEAQDLSPMQLRIIARRARRGSMTILGDLAQATASGGQTRWTEAIDMLAAPTTRYEELTVGYRVPAPILDFANRLLPQAAPGLRPTTSARTRGEAPRLVTSDPEARATAIVAEARALSARWTSTAIVVPDSLRDETVEALFVANVEFTDGQKMSELGEHVTLLTPATTKGLEFDAVLVVEPNRIITENEHGIRLLYIALTRAVQELTIVHGEHLPAALTA